MDNPSAAGGYGRLLATYLGPQRRRVLLLAGLVLLTLALQLINPQVIRYFLDSVQSGGQLRQLLGAAALFMAITLMQQFVLLGATYVGELVGWTATNALRVDLARHCLSLDLSFHKAHTPGELIERVDGDVNELANFFSRMILTLVGNGLLLIGVVILLWRESWQIGFGITLVALVSVIIVNQLRKRITPRWEALRGADADLFGFLEERLSGTEDIQTSGAKGYTLRRLDRMLRQRWRAAQHALHLDAWIIPTPIWVFALAYAAAHLVSGRLYLEGGLTIGSVYVIFYYVGLVEGPLWQTVEMVDQLQRATAALNRIVKLRAVEPTLHDGEGVTLPPGPLAVTFDHVSFQYDDADSLSGPVTQQQDGATVSERAVQEVVIRDLSFHLAPGMVLGLLGRTGSGKSTLSKLLFRFYDPTTGSIRLGTPAAMYDLRQARRRDLQGRIGMVTQDVQLFHASVRDNLTLFDSRIPDARILAVLEEIGLSAWLNSLPDGLDTQLSGDDSNLSAGEAQLLAFTRVFLADPGLVILDEASSRLDPATEQRIETALNRLLAGDQGARTCIIIAHRLATVQRADAILILEEGRILEYGDRMALAADPTSRFAHLLKTGLQDASALDIQV
ncbi:MAG: ABC transporter ATP-binding protein/permease [Caldilineaceae bacterium]|nr:ABC transporter ATP-binding protein/permease [Caldilineaceae bacterium]